jgi:acyl-CoA reductase-like NAD-dependent aldehyde dehydrogenase
MTEIIRIANWIAGAEAQPRADCWIDKFDPHSGKPLYRVAASDRQDTDAAIGAAVEAFPAWSAITPVRRGQILSDIAAAMKRDLDALADCIALETGKPPQDARGEIGASILQAEYFAGEGMRLHGRSLTSSMPGRSSHTVRQPRGVAGLIVPANTPMANIAWKVFPALICGNTAVLKAAEDSPRIADLFARLTQAAGLPDGVLNVVQGGGQPAGGALVEDDRVAVISFTGSTGVGKWIAEAGARRLARVSLELGGKNPFVVCDDADLDHAAHWAALSAFSNAGQRCAAGSRFLIFESVYADFRDRFVAKAKALKLGVDIDANLGPVVNARQHASILAAIADAKAAGGEVLCGGGVPTDPALTGGYYIQPTIIDGLDHDAPPARRELFGPVATLHPIRDMAQALRLANATEYGLTAAIHTRDVNRAMWFAQNVRAGVANVNMGTYGSEPHMPFGGFGLSGNGTREPGLEALDVYSELKNISFLTRPEAL